MNNVKKIIVGLCLSLCLPFSVRAQFVQDFNPPPSPCCLPRVAAHLADELQDWNQLGRYHQDDLRLEEAPAVEGRVVFLGDSITDGWDLAKYFPGKPYVNRGISGQTTMQMLVRMHPDVIHLHPAAFILLAGTNDIARNTGPETLEMVEDNIRAMCELAASHNIKIILCLLTPISDYTQGETDRAPAARGYREPQSLDRELCAGCPRPGCGLLHGAGGRQRHAARGLLRRRPASQRAGI